ncbi:MAG: alpha-amylase family glycosyl hydrolase [Paludibacteraceae bacterium]|nr:alpha-amylase family glycosyl hydrolase [Paludibacteraceae bacterium]
MKKLFILLASVFSLTALNAQISSVPEIIRIGDQTTEFKIIFDATKGSGKMVGQSTCEVYTGLVTTKSVDDYDLKNLSVWTSTASKYKLTKVEGSEDKWELTITGGINKYYGISNTTKVLKLMFMFKTKDRKVFTEPFYYTLTKDGYIVSPKAGENVIVDESVKYNYKAVSTIGEVDSLVLDLIHTVRKDTVRYKAENATEIAFDSAITRIGTYKMELKLYQEEKVVVDSLRFNIKEPTSDMPEIKPMPSYLNEGINYLPGGKVGLVLRAPQTMSATVLGDFNSWEASDEYKMYKDSIFFWSEFTLPIDEETGKPDTTKYYAFMYRVDGTTKIPDPYAEWYLDTRNDSKILDRLDEDLKNIIRTRMGVSGYISVLRHSDPNPYKWQNNETWQAPLKQDLVIYEVCLRDFATRSKTPQGTAPGTTVGSLAELMEKLDYIEHLGVNAIELMPIMEFDSNESWGYNPVFYYALDKAYATKNLFKEFVDECHGRGIAVILDVAFNHVNMNNTWAKLGWDSKAGKAKADNPWVNRDAKHMWSVEQDLNHEYDGTRQYFRRCLQYWLNEYKVDGFRMDLAKGFTQKKTTTNDALTAVDPTRMNILLDYGNAAWEANPNAYYILEYFVDYQEESAMSNAGALPWRNMNYNFGQAAEGYASGSNFVDSNGKGGMFDNGWVGYASSHDEERNFYRVKQYGAGDLKKNEAARIARVPEYIAFATLIPGPKMIWQFDEMGYDINLEYGGSNIERKPVPWSTGYKALKYDVDGNRCHAYSESSKIIQLRTKHPELFRSNVVTVANSGSASVSTVRKIVSKTQNESGGYNYVIILANFNATNTLTASAVFPVTGTWYDYMKGTEFTVEDKTQKVTLEPGEMLVYSTLKIDAPVEAEETQDAEDLIMVYPTIVENTIHAYSVNPVESIIVYDAIGSVRATSFNSDEVDMSGMPIGHYYVNVKSNGVSKNFKVVKR